MRHKRTERRKNPCNCHNAHAIQRHATRAHLKETRTEQTSQEADTPVVVAESLDCMDLGLLDLVARVVAGRGSLQALPSGLQRLQHQEVKRGGFGGHGERMWGCLGQKGEHLQVVLVVLRFRCVRVQAWREFVPFLDVQVTPYPINQLHNIVRVQK